MSGGIVTEARPCTAFGIAASTVCTCIPQERGWRLETTALCNTDAGVGCRQRKHELAHVTFVYRDHGYKRDVLSDELKRCNQNIPGKFLVKDAPEGCPPVVPAPPSV
jgi:hypothetical protein